MSEQFEAKVKVGVDASEAKAQIGYLQTMMKTFSKEVTERFVSIFSAVAVVKMGFDKVSEAMNHNLQVAKQIGQLSSKFHIDPKEVHSIMLSAESAGVSVRNLLMGMKNLGAAAGKAVVNKDFANAFKMMGMDAKNLGDMASKPAKHFAEVAKQLMMIGSETTRAAVGTKLLGRGYQQLAPLIEKLGTDEEARLKFLNNENALDNEDVAQAKQAAKTQAEMKEGFEKLVSGLMPLGNMIVALLTLVANGIANIFAWAKHHFADPNKKTFEENADVSKTAGALVEELGFNKEKWEKGGSKRYMTASTGDEQTIDYHQRAFKGVKAEVGEDYNEQDFVMKEALARAEYLNNQANSDKKLGDWLKKKGLSQEVQWVKDETTGEQRAETVSENARRIKTNLDALRTKNQDGTLGEIDWAKLAASVQDENLQRHIENLGRVHTAVRESGVKLGSGDEKNTKTGEMVLAGAEGRERYEEKYNKGFEQRSEMNDKAWHTITNFFTGANEVQDPVTKEWYQQNEKQIRFHRKEEGEDFDYGKDVVNEIEDEKHAKTMKKLDRAGRHAETEERVAKLGRKFDGAEVVAAELKQQQAIEDTAEAEAELEKKRQENYDAQIARQEAESELAMAYDEMMRTAVVSEDGKTMVADAEAARRYAAALEAVAQKRTAALNAQEKMTEATNATTKAKTAEANAIENVAKAEDELYKKRLQGVRAREQEGEDFADKEFNRKIQDMKRMGRPKEETDKLVLGRETEKLNDAAKAYRDAIDAANSRANEDGSYQESDIAEIKRREKDMVAQYHKTQDTIESQATGGKTEASEMRKIGGGGVVFNGGLDTGQSVIEANRKKIPLLERIAKAVEGKRDYQGLHDRIDPDTVYKDDFRPTD